MFLIFMILISKVKIISDTLIDGLPKSHRYLVLFFFIYIKFVSAT